MTKKMKNLIGLPVRVADNTLDIINRGFKVLGLPSLFTVGGVAVGPSVTAQNLTNACQNASEPAFTVAPMEIWIKPNGSDITGTGTQSNPFQTFTKAFSVIPRRLRHKVVIKPYSGNYTAFPTNLSFTLEGGSLFIDGSFNANPTPTHANLTLTNVGGGIPAEPIHGQRFVYDLTVNGTPFTANTLNDHWVYVRSGAATGRYYPIFKNTNNMVQIGASFQTIIPGDIIDIITIPVLINNLAHEPINISFDREGLHDTPDTEQIDFGVAACGFFWLNTTAGQKLLSLSGCNSAFAFSQIWRNSSNLGSTCLSATNCSINTVQKNGLFHNPIFDQNITNWLGMNVGSQTQTVRNSAMILDNCALRNVMCHSEVIVSNTISLFSFIAHSVSNLFGIPRPATITYQIVYLDDEQLNTAATQLENGHLYVISGYVRNSFLGVLLDSNAFVKSVFFLAYPTGPSAGIRQGYGFSIGTGVNVQIMQSADCAVLGPAGAFEFLGGNQSNYPAFPADGSWESDGKSSTVGSH